LHDKTKNFRSMKISVVIPTYNRPYLLGKCLLSLLSQDFPAKDYEIIVVTDGPDTATRQMVLQYTSQISLPAVYCLSLPEKKGPAAARNMGWRNARGELIVFTDDDCIPSTRMVSNYWHTYRHQGQALVAFTGKIKVPVSPAPTDYERNTARLENADFVTANCACTRKALELVGGFDEDFTMAWREDSDLEFKLLNHRVPILRKIPAQVVHPVRLAPWGISIKEQKKSMYNALLYKKHRNWYRSRISKAPQWRYYGILLVLLLALLGLVYRQQQLTIVSLVCWLLLTGSFIAKRLSGASRSPAHISEMVVTSIVIPVLSVFWTLYGSIKYKVVFL
jgi:glycosyltransferase involved in cell wall biosynthesis